VDDKTRAQIFQELDAGPRRSPEIDTGSIRGVKWHA